MSGVLLSQVALELSKAEDLSYEIVFKLHSEERGKWRESYPWLIDSEVQVVDTKKDVLHKLLAESEIQIGVGSTALYEGLAFGLKTCLMDGPGIDYFDSLVKSGTAIMIDSAEDFKAKLRDIEKLPPPNIESFFKTGATRSIVEFIESFCKSST
jgi:hypothetical protein